MKISHLVLIIVAVVAAVVAFITLGHAASRETTSVASQAVAIPNQAAVTAAEANVQAALPALTAYYAEHGTYTGASAAVLRSYNQGLSPALVIKGASSAGFCLEDTVDGATASATATTGPVVQAACP